MLKRLTTSLQKRLLIRYTEGKIDFGGYTPSYFDTTDITVNIDDKTSAQAELWDTAGEEQRQSRWRHLSYPQTDIFFICYSVAAVEEILTRERIEFFTQEIKGIFENDI